QVPSISVQTAVMILALLPVAILSPFVQRHFKKGMLIGAIKG
ncbi:carbohydrate ABC transporter permease, partial [Streptomyces sp. B6B3]